MLTIFRRLSVLIKPNINILAFTLIELLATLVIIAAVFSMVGASIIFPVKMFTNIKQQQHALYMAEQALHNIELDLKSAAADSVYIQPQAKSIHVLSKIDNLADSEMVKYTCNLSNQNITRQQGVATAQLVATGITDCDFIDQTSIDGKVKYITINITVDYSQQTISLLQIMDINT